MFYLYEVSRSSAVCLLPDIVYVYIVVYLVPPYQVGTYQVYDT